jgi:mRNA interferase RelE/StbE
MAHYAVSFRRSAEKDLRKLDATVRRRVLRSIDALVVDPRALPGAANCMAVKTPIVSARVIYTVDDEVLVVAIERVRHRREVYR